MTIKWADDYAAPPKGYFDPKPDKPGRSPGLHCECGRFAKWVGDRHYYNGNFDCYSYTVACSRCGDVTIECV